MRKLIGLSLSLALALTGLAVLPTSAANVSNERGTGTYDFGPVSCLGEGLHLEGKWHRVITETYDGAGGSHTTFHSRVTFVGVGTTTGNVYRGSDTNKTVINTGSGGLPVTNTVRDTLKMVGQGKAPDYTLTFTQHLTINANGIVTVSNILNSVSCK